MQTGQSILKPNNAEVTNISPFGIWVLVNGEEYFIDYKEYPFFFRGSNKRNCGSKV